LATKGDIIDWVTDAIRDAGGRASILFVAQHIWDNHEKELRASGDLFFTWQYDMRWAAHNLRKRGELAAVGDSRRGEWILV
jgi:hypothetical protein